VCLSSEFLDAVLEERLQLLELRGDRRVQELVANLDGDTRDEARVDLGGQANFRLARLQEHIQLLGDRGHLVGWQRLRARDHRLHLALGGGDDRAVHVDHLVNVAHASALSERGHRVLRDIVRLGRGQQRGDARRLRIARDGRVRHKVVQRRARLEGRLEQLQV